MINQESCLTFPCSFPLKVMGLNTGEFSSAVLSIFHKHLSPDRITVSERPSSGEKYLSLTVTFIAESKDQLDAIYRELNGHRLVLMTL